MKVLPMLFFLVVVSSAFAQVYPVRVYTKGDGLVSNSVLDLMQDSRGFLWIGTPDGASLYDGATFTNYNEQNGLQYPHVTGFAEDKNGAVWIATIAGGVYKWMDGTIVNRFQLGVTAEDNAVMSLAVDSSNTLWFTTRNGLYSVREEALTLMQKQMLPNSRTELVVDRKGRLWQMTIGKDTRVDVHSQNTSVSSSFLLLPQGGRSFDKIIVDSRGSIWATGSRGQLAQLSDTGIVFSATIPVTEPRGFVDGGNGLWYCFNKDGLFEFSPESPASINRFDIFAPGLYDQGDYQTVFRDKENTLWIGMQSLGAAKLSERNVMFLAHPRQPKTLLPYHALSDRDNRLWISGRGGLYEVSRTAQGNWQQYFHPIQNNPNCAFRPWLIDNEHKLWISCLGESHQCKRDILRIEVSRSTADRGAPRGISRWSFGINFGARSNPVLWVDKKNRLWVSEPASGISVFELETQKCIRRFDSLSGLRNVDIKAMCEDTLGNIWVGTSNDGIVVFSGGDDPAILGRHTIQTGLAHNSVRSITRAKDGSMWIGTRWGGISLFRRGRFTALSTANGLEGNHVSGFGEDAVGRMWVFLGQDFRVQSVDIATLRVFPPLSVFDRGRSEASVGMLHDVLWHSDADGVLLYNFISDTVRGDPPQISIRSIRVNGTTQTVSSPSEFSAESNLSIFFSATTFKNEALIRYKHRLVGANDSWSEWTSARTITFGALKPGRFAFEVVANNGKGQESVKPAVYAFTVLAPWYRTGFAFTMYTLLILAALATVRGYEKKRDRLKLQTELQRVESEERVQQEFSKQLMETQEGERSRLAGELHDSLVQSLLIAKNRSLLAQKKLANPEVVGKDLGDISSVLDEAIEEVRTIAHNLRPYQLDRLGVTRAIQALVKRVDEASTIRLLQEIDNVDAYFTPETGILLFRIVQEGITNILKHSDATEANIVMKLKEKGIELTIADNGKGVSDTSAEARLSGFGLSGIDLRCRILKGSLNVFSGVNKGTTLTMLFRTVRS